MANEPNSQQPNPVLRLLTSPTQVGIEGRGKGERTIKEERLFSQQVVLHKNITEIINKRENIKIHGRSRILLKVKMFSDSLAPTHTPGDILPVTLNCHFVAPLLDGYLVDVDIDNLYKIADRIKTDPNLATKSDISRVESITYYHQINALRDKTTELLWNQAIEGNAGRLFIVWLRPYQDNAARAEVIKEFKTLATENTILALRANNEEKSLEQATSTDSKNLINTSIDVAIQKYSHTKGVGRAVIEISSKKQLDNLIASGTVFRLDPARPIISSSSPNIKSTSPPPEHPEHPVVAVIDGGFNEPDYLKNEAWKEPEIINQSIADTQHGNAISSLIVNAKNLNPNIDIHKFGCKFGTLQAVPRHGVKSIILEDDLLDAIANMSLSHKEVRVWNLSLNYDASDSNDYFSSFGHELSVLARTRNCLPVISAGNILGQNSNILPPADCEAALTIGGRSTTNKGEVGNPCSISCQGPGPQGSFKPELSGHSKLNVAGGITMEGTSFPTASFSALAAHTFENVKNATPDLVKALLINRSERDSHHPTLGWGTPPPNLPPWECPAGTATILWVGEILPSTEYHWNDIPIPDELLTNGKIVGEAALTAILEPLVSPFGTANYFSSRVEVALQYQVAEATSENPNGTWKNLLGTMKESTLKESEARSDLKKWNPIRHHKQTSHGKKTASKYMRVRVRVFTRDLYQPSLPSRDELLPQKVSLVLTLKAKGNSSTLYNTMKQELGTRVEIATVDQTITIDDTHN